MSYLNGVSGFHFDIYQSRLSANESYRVGEIVQYGNKDYEVTHIYPISKKCFLKGNRTPINLKDLRPSIKMKIHVRCFFLKEVLAQLDHLLPEVLPFLRYYSV